MAYMNQEKKAIIKAALDQALAGSGIKYSLRVRNNLSIDCTIKSAPINFIENHKAARGGHGVDLPYIQVNQFWFNDNFTGEAAQVLSKIFDCLKAAGWYDRSDAMIDYFETAYYITLNIGSWDKPFKYIPAAPKKIKTMALDYYQDPGHGWVKIGLDKLAALGIAEDISSYSYMRNGFAYLEEDGDLSQLFTACDAAGIKLKLRSHNCNNRSKIRSYDPYKTSSQAAAWEAALKEKITAQGCSLEFMQNKLQIIAIK